MRLTPSLLHVRLFPQELCAWRRCGQPPFVLKLCILVCGTRVMYNPYRDAFHHRWVWFQVVHLLHTTNRIFQLVITRTITALEWWPERITTSTLTALEGWPEHQNILLLALQIKWKRSLRKSRKAKLPQMMEVIYASLLVRKWRILSVLTRKIPAKRMTPVMKVIKKKKRFNYY